MIFSFIFHYVKLLVYNITNKILSNYPDNIHYLLYDTFGIHLTINNKEVILEKQIIMVIIMLIILNLILILLAKIKKNFK